MTSLLEIGRVELARGVFRLRVDAPALPAGVRLQVVGPSGGGKSTLLRALVGLEGPDCTPGLRWQGRALAPLPPHRRPFGWMPQDLGLWPHLRADQHVALARTRGAAVAPQAVDHDLLSRLGLAGRAHARPAELSGGERQRLAFARVLAAEPAWAVLDEPFSHLDPVLAAELGHDFGRLAAQQGRGIIEVNHQLRRVGDDEVIWVVESGRLTQCGRWAELAAAPATQWVDRWVSLQRAVAG